MAALEFFYFFASGIVVYNNQPIKNKTEQTIPTPTPQLWLINHKTPKHLFCRGTKIYTTRLNNYNSSKKKFYVNVVT